MSEKSESYKTELRPLLDAVLAGNEQATLESYLLKNSNLPGPRANLELVSAFAELVAEIVILPNPPVERLENLLDGCADISLQTAPVNHPREILPAAAVRSYGKVAVARPDWWTDEIAKLRKAAANPRWRTREMVAAALQDMLESDWPRNMAEIKEWLATSKLLLCRAAVAAVAEPRLLLTVSRARNALEIQKQAIARLADWPVEQRKEEEFKILRQALGYTLSVVVAALPEEGFVLLERLAALPDKDVRWVVRENLKKNRLSKWPDKLAQVQKLV
ncbi:MAG TPA: hypothetical protein VH186_07505 [Chloroflexia bacterium]|nr:hypothetical protein [Chloroflexia bacterium]